MTVKVTGLNALQARALREQEHYPWIVKVTATTATFGGSPQEVHDHLRAIAGSFPGNAYPVQPLNSVARKVLKGKIPHEEVGPSSAERQYWIDTGERLPPDEIEEALPAWAHSDDLTT